MEEVRSAGVRTPDRLAAGLDSRGIAAAAKEIGSTWRVYVKQWLIDSRHDDEQGAAVAAQKYAGRLLEGDMFAVEDFDNSWLLMTKRWNVHSEWKYVTEATKVVEALAGGEDVQLVARNSRDEHKLLQYGILRIA